MIEQVYISCNGKTIIANLLSRTSETLQVYVVASDIKMALTWVKTQYVGNKAGMEFTSNGKVIR